MKQNLSATSAAAAAAAGEENYSSSYGVVAKERDDVIGQKESPRRFRMKRSRTSVDANCSVSDDSAVGSDLDSSDDQEPEMAKRNNDDGDDYNDDDNYYYYYNRAKRMKLSKSTCGRKFELPAAIEMFEEIPSCPERGVVGGGGAGGSGRGDSGGRLLMRQWLQQQADRGTIPGLYWYDEPRRMQIRIPWKHGSRTGWTVDDCKPYRAWAEYTGKIACVSEPKKWKANFRCALNSLPDVRELTELCQKKGSDPFKVYHLLPELPRKSQTRKTAFKPKREVKTEDNFDEIESEFSVKEELDLSSHDDRLHQSFNFDESFDVNERVSLADDDGDNSNFQNQIDFRMTTSNAKTTQPILTMIPTVVEEISEDTKDAYSLSSSSVPPVVVRPRSKVASSSVQSSLSSQLTTSSSLLSFMVDASYRSKGRYLDDSSGCGSDESWQVLNEVDLGDILPGDMWTTNYIETIDDTDDFLLNENENINLMDLDSVPFNFE